MHFWPKHVYFLAQISTFLYKYLCHGRDTCTVPSSVPGTDGNPASSDAGRNLWFRTFLTSLRNGSFLNFSYRKIFRTLAKTDHASTEPLHPRTEVSSIFRRALARRRNLWFRTIWRLKLTTTPLCDTLFEKTARTRRFFQKVSHTRVWRTTPWSVLTTGPLVPARNGR